MPARLTITVPDSVMADVEAQKPRSLSLAAFCALLIDQGLTASATLVERRGDTPGRVDPLSEASKAVSSSSSKKNISINKNKAAKYIFSVPPALDQVKDELLEFWRDYKDGKKTRAAGSMLITGCQAILDKYGVTVLREQIQLACANNWQGITLKGYEQYGLVTKIKGFTPAEPQHKHPAYRPASEVLAESERLAQQNLEHLRRKQEEAQPVSGPLADLF